MTQNLVLRAQAFALEAHKDQKYGKLPYDFHLRAVVVAMFVAALVVTAGVVADNGPSPMMASP